eukprot:Gb_29273 [translate_table: standard]
MARRTEYAGSSSSGNGGQSIVEDHGVHKTTCGYCKSNSRTSIAHGLLAYNLRVDDYQELLDRGWRRSGRFLYKPEMEWTCCPQYTIRLEVDRFVPSKEQTRVYRRMQRFLDGTYDRQRTVTDKEKEDNLKSGRSCSSTTIVSPNEGRPGTSSPTKELSALGNTNSYEIDEVARYISRNIDEVVKVCGESGESGELTAGIKFPQACVKKVTLQMKKKLKGLPGDIEYTSNIAFQIAAILKRMQVPGKTKSAPDVSLDGKARDDRSQEASPLVIAERLASKLETFEELSSFLVQACDGHLNFISSTGPGNSTENILSKTSAVNECNDLYSRKIEVDGKRSVTSNDSASWENHKKHRLEIRMKRSSFDSEEFDLYRKYQIRVHNDKPEEVKESSYRRFLVDTPVIFVPPTRDNTVPPSGFGSFHQQYLIDGQLVAVGVVDILPRCLSSKYLFWDPDLAFLSLGKYSALEEIKWVQEAQKHCSTLQYYYLGYYIHSCRKMRYKAAYNPSELLCPVRYQ